MNTHKVNPIMEECRKLITPEIQKQVDLCVSIANRVYDLLEEQGMTQRDFARALGKTETEVSRWLCGTHNLTIATIAKMSVVLNDDIIVTTFTQKQEPRQYSQHEIDTTMVAEPKRKYRKRK